MEPGSTQHSGYLTPGDEINIQGGITVHFKKKQRRYWNLQYLGEGNLVLYGYKDEKSFNRSSSPTKTSTLGRQRKLSSAPMDTIRLMTSLKVHKIEMKTKKKVENALIVVSGSHPKFFRPDNKDELEKWHSVFMKFVSDVQPIKRRVRARHSPEHQATESPRQDLPSLERDSGVSTSFSRSPCPSQRSSSSSTSSDGMCEYSPSRFFPSTVFCDIEDDDHNTSPAASPSPSPTLREHAGRQRSGRASIFVRNSEGIYEERTASSSRESTESGFYETMLPRNDDSRPNSLNDAFSSSSDNVQPKLRDKQTRRSKLSTSSSFETTDSIPEEEEEEETDSVTERLAKTLGIENSPELQQILEDDGHQHNYINFNPKNSSSPRLPDRPRRKTSLTTRMSDSDYHQEVLSQVSGSRGRSYSVPIDCEFLDTSNQDYASNPSEPPIPEDTQPLSDVEKLIGEQAREKIVVEIDKKDLIDSLALVDIKGKVMVAGWVKGLYGKLHVGDHLIQVNEQLVSEAEWANKFIKTSSRSTISLHINRLPYAMIINCTRIHEETVWGIECKANEIMHVRSGPAKESGLTERSELITYSKKSCEWIITEAMNKPIKLTCSKDEMLQYLATRDLDLPIVVQPKDFIQDLRKALGKLKRSSFYHVG